MERRPDPKRRSTADKLSPRAPGPPPPAEPTPVPPERFVDGFDDEPTTDSFRIPRS